MSTTSSSYNISGSFCAMISEYWGKRLWYRCLIYDWFSYVDGSSDTNSCPNSWAENTLWTKAFPYDLTLNFLLMNVAYVGMAISQGSVQESSGIWQGENLSKEIIKRIWEYTILYLIWNPISTPSKMSSKHTTIFILIYNIHTLYEFFDSKT